MDKRRFELHGDQLDDDSVDPVGRPLSYGVRVGRFEEMLRLPDGEWLEFFEERDLRRWESREPIEENEGIDRALMSLESSDFDFHDGFLRRHGADPRIRIALVSHLERFPALSISASRARIAITALGVSEAAPVLRARMNELQSGESLRDSFVISCLASMAADVLSLEPAALDAAEVLVRILAYPDAEDRNFAALRILDVWRPDDTSTMQHLAGALHRLLEGGDDELFCLAFRALGPESGADAWSRMESLLRAPSYSVRESAAMALAIVCESGNASAVAMFGEWLQREPETSLAIILGGARRQFVSVERMIKLCERGLALAEPWLRYRAVKQLLHLPPENAAEVATRALVDEPDPFLQRTLEAISRRR